MMDTPERSQMNSSTPISKFQESPFSSFINSLSPINPTKSVHVSLTLGSLSFASPPSVFTSPHVSLLKDTFLRRHQVFELEKSPFASDGGSKDSIASIANADQQSTTLVQGEGSAKPLKDSSECTTELQRVLTYDNEGPQCKSKTVNCSDKDARSEGDTSMALVPIVQDHPKGTSGTELNPQDMNHNTEEEGCDWQSLIAYSSDQFIFSSPNVTATSKQSLRKSQEEEAIVLPLSLLPPGGANDMQNSLRGGSDTCNEAHETIEQSTQPMDEVELQQIHQPSENQDISSLNEFLSSDTGDQPGKKAFGHLHRGLLRRCLTFEMPRTKMNIEGVVFSNTLPSSQTEEKQLSCNRQPVTPRGDSSKCILSGIGLHLNALASTPKDSGIPNQGILSSISQDPIINSSLSSLRKDEGPAGSTLEIAEDFSKALVYASNELYPNSPKKKRKKPETVEEGGSCKHCNCKKSKCLKLYCECFAAGIYCVEPCSCQDCFNKPIHKDIVLATRNQIESRNPLAFAPKVIRTTDSAQELGQEDSNRTPASARHKQGCNCKKSSCLKKYCECYQGGVGCSISCRCEGCKNAFGRKDGSILRATGPDMENPQASEKIIKDKTDISIFQDGVEQNSEFAIPQTPSRLHRSSVPPATSSKGKPPRSSLGTINPSSGLLSTDGKGRSTFLRSQSESERDNQKASIDDIPLVLQHTSPPSSGSKTLSPNSKRISSPQSGNTQAIGLRSSRKLILRSIPSFPSLSPRH